MSEMIRRSLEKPLKLVIIIEGPTIILLDLLDQIAAVVPHVEKLIVHLGSRYYQCPSTRVAGAVSLRSPRVTFNATHELASLYSIPLISPESPSLENLESFTSIGNVFTDASSLFRQTLRHLILTSYRLESLSELLGLLSSMPLLEELIPLNLLLQC